MFTSYFLCYPTVYSHYNASYLPPHPQPPQTTLFPYHDALPISQITGAATQRKTLALLALLATAGKEGEESQGLDRKSTRLNSSHQIISYAVFCLKKKK